MSDLEKVLSLLFVKYGKEIFLDEDRLLKQLSKILVTDINRHFLESVRILYDSGVAQRLLDADKRDRGKELAKCQKILEDEYMFGHTEAANALLALAGALGFSRKDVKPFALRNKQSLSPMYVDSGEWSREKGMELAPGWESYFKGCIYSFRNKDNLALKEARKAAKYGDSRALTSLGYCYQDEQDYKAAKKLYLKAAQMGDANAMVLLSDLYLKVFNDITESNKWLIKAGNAGDPQACKILSDISRENNDNKKSADWLLKAAEAGNFESMALVGYKYDHYLGDYENAKKWYLRAAQRGNLTSAMSTLGILYDTKFNNLEEAEKWFLKSAESGDPEGMYNLAYLYDKKLHDLAKAMTWYKRAADLGYEGAMTNLGFLYQRQGKFDEAEKLHLKACKEGNPRAMTNLGSLYSECGHPEKALYWLHKAEKAGNVKALVTLGSVYYFYYHDDEKAKEYYLKAADAGVVDGFLSLGFLYGNAQDYNSAETYFIKGAEAGDYDALFQLGLLYLNELKNYERAKKSFMEILNIYPEHYSAIISLGLAYEATGEYEEAEKYLLKAANAGYIEAMEYLGDLYASGLNDRQKAEKWRNRAANANPEESPSPITFLDSDRSMFF